MNKYDFYSIFDSPIPYKNIKIYPVLVKDYLNFTGYSSCLIVDKNTIPDAKIISMTYLEYLYYATQKDENTPYILWLDRLFSLCLRDEKSFENIKESITRYKYDEKGKVFFTIGEIEYNSDDFDEIRNIICSQNILDIPDDKVQKEVRDSLEEARKYREKHSGTKQGSFEDYMIALSISTGWTLDYIYNMTIRKFIKSVRRTDNLIHYKIYLSASMSGMVEFKDKSFIKHWMSDLDSEDKYSDVAVGVEDMSNKINVGGS